MEINVTNGLFNLLKETLYMKKFSGLSMNEMQFIIVSGILLFQNDLI